VAEKIIVPAQDMVFESTMLQLEQINETDISVKNKQEAIANLTKIVGICNNLLKAIEKL